ncbi:MAG TPA: lysine 5,6-aminomutase subunit alpha [Solirubrobacterales bacterium]
MASTGSKLDLDAGLVDGCRQAAAAVAEGVAERIAGCTTVSVERMVVRMLGVDGVDRFETPLPNVVVDHVHHQGKLDRGIAFWLGGAMARTGLSAQQLAEGVAAGELDLCNPDGADPEQGIKAASEATAEALAAIHRDRAQRGGWISQLDDAAADRPQRYVLTATGNVYEDVRHAEAVADHGGDTIAVIRSTAQSLLDYVPFGPTEVGHGGTFATQQNFRIMRDALDAWSCENGRYMRLSSFCSGLCMPEIAAIGAIEGLDNMVNDALYGILYRDIHMRRTLIDQSVSRRINGYAGIVINTGEDSYLRTADPVESAPSVVASQLINYNLARSYGVPDEQIAIGNAFEIDMSVENGLLLEWAQAQLTRELFPECPVKFMPPTKHMNGNPFRTHACDTLFNLVTVATNQDMQTIGVPTEGVFTPHIHDRVLGLESVEYAAVTARDLGDEIEFKRGGIIQSRADEVLRGAAELLEEIVADGLFAALERGRFGNIERREDQGRGIEGIVECGEDYFNPVIAQMEVGAPGVESGMYV